MEFGLQNTLYESIEYLKLQEELQEVKQKLERFKHLLRLERKKKDRTQEKAKRLTTSLNGIKSESNKQKQLLNKFNFLFDLDSATGSGNREPEESNDDVTQQETEMTDQIQMIQVIDNEETVYQVSSNVQEVTSEHSKPEMSQKLCSKSSQNNVSIGPELLRKIVTGNNSKKGLSTTLIVECPR